MSHIDDGLLHAYLDGALHAEDPAEAERVERHVAVCDDCRARLDAARQLRVDADVLLEAAAPTDLDMPPFEAIAERARERSAKTGGGRTNEGGEVEMGPRGPAVADARTTRRRRYTFTRTLAWAASIVMALGMGWWARELAFRPGGLPPSPAQQFDGAGTANALETGAPAARTRTAAPSAEASNAAQPPAAGKQAAVETERATAAATQPTPKAAQATTTAAQATTTAAQATTPTAQATAPAAQPTPKAGRGTVADQQTAGAAPRQPVARLAPAAQQPKAVEEPSNAMAEMTPSITADAVMRGMNLSGMRLRLLTVGEASTWLGGPVYGVGGLDVLGVVPYTTRDGARAVTVYQRLPGSDTLGLHQLRTGSGNAFTLGPGVTGVIRNGTLIYAGTTLPPDSLQALLRRLVPLRR